MKFKVEITQAALTDAEDYVRFIKDDRQDFVAAERWWNGLVNQLLSLETLPQRCPKIPEQKYFVEEVRHLLYASHRIIFCIEDNTVTILRVYHGAKKPFRAEDR